MALAATRPPATTVESPRLDRRRKLLVFAAALLLLALCFKAIVRGDGIGYYSYLPAVVADHTLNMQPTFDDFLAAGVPAYANNLQVRVPNGLTANYKQVGSAVMAFPFYAAALVVLGVTTRNQDPALDPVSQFAFTAAALFYALLALLLLYRFARRLWSLWPAGLAIAAGVFATPLVAYLFFEPSYNHAFTFAAITIFALTLYQTGPDRRGWQWLLLGIIGGVMSITHVQEVLFMALVPAEALWLWRRRRWSARLLPGYLLIAGGFAIGVLPQVAVDRALYGRWLPPSAPNIGFDFLHPRVIDLLFSTHHGWIAWSPLVVVAFLGLPLLVRRLGWFAIALIVICLGELWLNAALTDWWGGLGFGSRRLTDQTLLLVLAFAAVFDWLRVRVPRLGPAMVSAGIAWTVVLLAQFYYVIKVDVGPSWRDFLLGQLRALAEVPRLFIQGSVIREFATGQLVPTFATGSALLVLLLLVLAIGRGLDARLSQAAMRGRVS